jgi:hypothetical protein
LFKIKPLKQQEEVSKMEAINTLKYQWTSTRQHSVATRKAAFLMFKTFRGFFLLNSYEFIRVMKTALVIPYWRIFHNSHGKQRKFKNKSKNTEHSFLTMWSWKWNRLWLGGQFLVNEYWTTIHRWSRVQQNKYFVFGPLMRVSLISWWYYFYSFI